MWVRHRTCSGRTLSTSSFNRDLQGIRQFCASMASSALGIALVLLASRFKSNLSPLKLIFSSSSPQLGSSNGQCLEVMQRSKPKTEELNFHAIPKHRQFTAEQGMKTAETLLLLPCSPLLLCFRCLQLLKKSCSKTCIAAKERRGVRLHIRVS